MISDLNSREMGIAYELLVISWSNPYIGHFHSAFFFAHPRWPTFLKLEGCGASGAAVSRWSAGCELWKLLTSSALDDGKLLGSPCGEVTYAI